MKSIIVNDFLPSLFGSDLDNTTHNGGLGIRDPVSTTELLFQSSYEVAFILCEAITLSGPFDMDKHEIKMKAS